MGRSGVAHDLFAVLPRGVDDLAAAELSALGARDLRPTAGGVGFAGDLAVAYRACLWSRLASRILLHVATVDAGSSTSFYAAVRELPWEEHLGADDTLAVDCHARADSSLNTHFVALKCKDAVVDRLRDRLGRRPGIDLDRPAVRLHVLVARGEARGSVDLAGEPLHRRGYRREGGPAPLKENVAAAMLLRAGWPSLAAAGAALLDPLCGAGTLPIEAAMIAADVAPGLLRERFGFTGWRGHRAELWATLRGEASERRRAGLAGALPQIAGSDRDETSVRRAVAHLAAAGLAERVRFFRQELDESEPMTGAARGLVACNPPYGERLGERAELVALYRGLGERLKARFVGWRLALLTADATLAGELRLRASRRNALWNGGLRCELLQYEIGGEVPGLNPRLAATRERA
jgi:23S rRNA (guanine2445-N2)-methyltransferase / 23S rRNA (guanine2069-N7)-methyltransferase